MILAGLIIGIAVGSFAGWRRRNQPAEGSTPWSRHRAGDRL